MLNNIQAVVNYQNSQNARNSDSDASIDRARGGIIKIELTIPEKTHKLKVSIGSGVVTIPAVKCTIEIDLEQMPLVNVSGYEIEEEQIGPDEMPYPNGAQGVIAEDFK
jgi:hypothetical protein